ncbi:MAG: O-antigen ligase family protein [Kiritimatiellae bacterium]|nr:O-antigen ligase family protein [Kiritimatiellia bacterium]
MSGVLDKIAIVLVSMPTLVAVWAYGGLDGRLFAQLAPYATMLALAAFVCPQRHGDERWATACRRVGKAMLHDPLLWVVVALFLYMLFPLFNVGLCPGCDWRAIDAGADPFPPLRHLPFCVRPVEHAHVVWWFVASLAGAFAARHALTRKGKCHLFELLVWNGVAVAILGFLQLLTEAQYPFWGKVERPFTFFATFAYPNMAGAFFTLVYAFSLGLWFHRMVMVEELTLDDERHGKLKHPILMEHYPVVAVALSFFAVLATLCRAAMMLVILLTVIAFLYMVGRIFAETGWMRARRLKSLVVAAVFMLGLFGAVTVYAPPKVLQELKTLTVLSVADRVSGRAQYHSRVASAIMRKYPLFGVGGWGYRHFSVPFMTETERKSLQGVGGANVHNDYLQFLVEHGLVGCGLLLACVYLLAAPAAGVWRRTVLQSIAAARSSMGVSSLAIFSVAPPVVWTFLGCCGALIHAFGDCPLRSPAVLSLLLFSLPLACGFLPREQESD